MRYARAAAKAAGILCAAAGTFWWAVRTERFLNGPADPRSGGYIRDTLDFVRAEGVPWLLWAALFAAVLLAAVLLPLGRRGGKDRLGRRFRRAEGDEYGGAHFEQPEEYAGLARISDVRSPETTGTILGQRTEDGRQVLEWVREGNRHNEHILIFGASGTGKTYVFSKNYAYQKFRCGESLVIADPDGGMERELRGMAMDFGYDVKSLNFNDFSRSHGWDCMQSLRNSRPEKVDELSQIFANTVIRNIRGSGRDPIYTEGPMSLLRALVLRVWLGRDFPPSRKNIKTVYEQLMQPNLEKYLDRLFEESSLSPEERPCLYPWRAFLATSKNLKGNLMSELAIQLQLLQGEKLSELLSTDEMDLEALGRRKCVYFCQFPDNNSTYDFLVSLFFSMLIQTLVNLAYRRPGGRLPVPVNFLLEEFPSIGVLNDWSRVMSTVRKRGVNIVMIVQDLTQLRRNYEDSWITILGNCATWISIGVNDPETAAILSRRIGEATIALNSRSWSAARAFWSAGSSSWHSAAGRRPLLSESELYEISEDDVLILFQGHNPVLERKFPHELHPFYRIYKEHEVNGEYPDPLGPMPPLSDPERRAERLRREEAYRRSRADALPARGRRRGSPRRFLRGLLRRGEGPSGAEEAGPVSIEPALGVRFPFPPALAGRPAEESSGPENRKRGFFRFLCRKGSRRA